VRTPHSATNPATVVGWKMVSVGGADVAGITVDVRRDVAIIGRFRMEAGSDPASAQRWATTSEVAQGDAMGRFSVAMPPGRCRVNAVPAPTFPSRAEARAGMSRIAFGGVAVALSERERKRVDVTLQER
jgi:hypothetical protein